MSLEHGANHSAFGIGCFHFGVKQEPPFALSGQKYIDELTKFLDSVPSVESTSTFFDEDFEKASLKALAGEEILSIMEGGDYFPAPLFGIISFVVRIPYRVQSFLIDTQEKFLDTYTEVFGVQIRYTYHWPVAFVSPINPTGPSDPATGVRVVREFLCQEFAKVDSKWIRFEYLGPSPYHIRCYIAPYSNKDGETQAKVSSIRQHSREYDQIDFLYDSEAFDDLYEVEEHIFIEIEDEISFFYRLAQLHRRRSLEWNDIRVSLTKLIDLQKNSGWKSHLNRMLKSQTAISRIFIDIADFESRDMGLESFTRDEYEALFISEVSAVIKYDVDKEIKNKIQYPTQEISRLVQFFEDRRNGSVETLVVIVAAILGGVVGALITAAFTGGR